MIADTNLKALHIMDLLKFGVHCKPVLIFHPQHIKTIYILTCYVNLLHAENKSGVASSILLLPVFLGEAH